MFTEAIARIKLHFCRRNLLSYYKVVGFECKVQSKSILSTLCFGAIFISKSNENTSQKMHQEIYGRSFLLPHHACLQGATYLIIHVKQHDVHETISQRRGGSGILRKWGRAKFLNEFISSMWHFNGRIFMLLSFPVYFESKFFGSRLV